MTNSNQDAELHVTEDQLLGVGPIHVATGRDTGSPEIEFDHTGTIDVGPGGSGSGGEVVTTHPSGGRVGVLSAENDAGSVKLRDESGNPTVSLDASGGPEKIRTTRGDNSDTTVAIGDTSDGGQFTVYDTPRNKTVVEGDPTPRGSGLLRLWDDSDRITCRLDGRDGGLVLSGPEESAPDGSGKDSDFGGGELVVQEDVGSTDGAAPFDIHVHATAEQDSDYGVDDDNRPRIVLDGPSATLDLGRGSIDSDREAVPGEVVVRDDRGGTLLTLSATANNTAEVAFDWSDDGTVTACGAIKAVRRGLAVTDSNGDTALLVTKLGEIKTKSSVQRI